MIKYISFLIILLGIASYCFAQDTQEVELGEVDIRAAKVINQNDGQLILPTKSQKELSANGYSLLRKLSLPAIKIDEITRTIVAQDNKGSVQIRINGVVASKEDLLSINCKTIKSVKFIEYPGLRYGEGIGYVIQISTQKVLSGYTIGADGANTFTSWQGSNSVYAKLNRGKSEWGLSYGLSYQDLRKGQKYEETDYVLNDGSHHSVTRQDIDSRMKSFEHALELKYNLADSSAYVFQAVVAAVFDNEPTNFKQRQVIDGTKSFLAKENASRNTFSPHLDLYFYRLLSPTQSLTANVVGTHINSNHQSRIDEGGDYAYHVSGSTWSLFSEAIYENRFAPFTLTAGLQHRIKTISNRYSESVESVNNMNSNNLYLFSEAKGKWGNLTYVAGLGISNDHYRQGKHKYDYWLFRPKATLTYYILQPLMISYDFELAQHISKVAMISDTKIRLNSMEWIVGNPALKPNEVVTHQLSLSYAQPRINTRLMVEYRMNHGANMSHYTRSVDNQFYYTQTNQHAVNMFYLSNRTQVDLIAEKLTLTSFGGIFRFINLGNDYRHFMTSYHIGGRIEAYLGKLDLSAQIDNGWKFMEGESWNKQGVTSYLQCGYHFGQVDLALIWNYPFQRNPILSKGGIQNANLKKLIFVKSADQGNKLTLSLSWKINRGSRYRPIQKKLQNKDTQTGILKESVK